MRHLRYDNVQKKKKTHGRSSHRRCSIKKPFLKIPQYSQENTRVGSLINKVASLQAFAKFLRTPILKNICGELLLTWPKVK